MKSLAESLLRMGVSTSPDSATSDRVGEIYVMLTYDCNLRCRHCPFWGQSGFCKDLGDASNETLRVSDVVRFVREAAPFRPNNVTLSGGEPLLSPMLGSVVAELSELGMKLDITTNGTLIADVPNEVLARVEQVNVSLDGPPLVLRRLGRGGEPTLEKAIEGMRRVNALKSVHGRPYLRLLAVITDEGAGHIAEMLDHFKSEGVELDSVHLQHRMFMDAETAVEHEQALGEVCGTKGVGIWEGLVGPPGRLDVEALHAELSHIAASRSKVSISPRLSLEQMKAFYGDGRWVPEELSGYCLAPWENVMLGPYGDVWLCPGFAIGNAHEASFAEIYNGDRAKALRRRIARDGVFPGCRACWHLDNYR